jgi:hypothetical protein
VILTEYPHVSGPSRERPGPVCVECLADVSASAGFACVCGLPLCGPPSCLDGPNHRGECELLQGLQGASARGSQWAGCQGPQGAGCQGSQEAGNQGLHEGGSQGLTEVVWDSETLQRLLDDLLPLRNAANMFKNFLFLFYVSSSSPYPNAFPTTNLFFILEIILTLNS